jgi:Fe-S-cluster containining protein
MTLHRQMAAGIAAQITENLPQFLELFRDAYLGGMDLLDDSLTNFESAMDRRNDIVDSNIGRVCEAAVEHDKRMQPACRKGCAFCCHQDIFCSTAELAHMALALRGLPNAGEVAEQCETTTVKLQGLTEGERFFRGIACPMLEKRLCSIHPIRPMACRTYLSASRYRCEQSWKKRPKTVSIPFLTAHQIVVMPIAFGIDAAVMRKGKHVGWYELSAGLPAIMRPGAVEEWWAGGNPFAGLPERREEGLGMGAAIREMLRMAGL